MSITGLLIGIILVTLTLLIAAFPLISRRDPTMNTDMRDKQHERLTVYYERVLRNLRDLDEDHDLGKIGDDEYAAERELWMQRGVQALKALERLDDEQIAVRGSDDAAVDAAISEAIESAVAHLKPTL